jgi:hypothetical protein
MLAPQLRTGTPGVLRCNKLTISSFDLGLGWTSDLAWRTADPCIRNHPAPGLGAIPRPSPYADRFALGNDMFVSKHAGSLVVNVEREFDLVKIGASI